MPAKIYLTNEQIKIIKNNYGLMTNTKLCTLVNSSPHTLRKYVQKLNIEQNINPKQMHNFDDGNGFFDVEKYLKAIY